MTHKFSMNFEIRMMQGKKYMATVPILVKIIYKKYVRTSHFPKKM